MDARLELIRLLASRSLQERYILNGAPTEYVIPEDLVGDVLTFIELVDSAKIGTSITAVQRNLLYQLRDALLVLEPNVVKAAASELDIDSKDWANLREAASLFLCSLEKQ